ncbi:MAG: DNA-formamidopyrimidine glycosylase [Erysipelotrichaceae bacterium]|jgi:formamidopyrimidine-DNA glycosylase|nr:DNA-formamidopyrimidine glycosylase [Erysipelotrichaceae bacterium]
MPELPEVETIKRYLEPLLKEKSIKEIAIIIDKHTPPKLEFERLLDAKLTSLTRRGKYLLFNFDNKHTLIIHLRMEGKFFFNEIEAKYRPHIIFIATFGDDRLYFVDTRRFARIELVKTSELISHPALQKLGPDLADDEIDSNKLYEKVKRSGTYIKKLLLDQTFVSGLGNIYVDESLFAAKINPYSKAKNLSIKEFKEIISHAKRILKNATEFGGTTVKTFHVDHHKIGSYQNELKVYQQENKPCPVCGFPIKKNYYLGRGTHFCPHCQRIKSLVPTYSLTGLTSGGKSFIMTKISNDFIKYSSDDLVNQLYFDDDFIKNIKTTFNLKEFNKNTLKEIRTKNPPLFLRISRVIREIIELLILKIVSEAKTPLVIEVPVLFNEGLNYLFTTNIGIDVDADTQKNNAKTRELSDVDVAAYNKVNAYLKYRHYLEYHFTSKDFDFSVLKIKA